MSYGALALIGLVITILAVALTFNYLQGNLPKWAEGFMTAVLGVGGMGTGIGMFVLNGMAWTSGM